MRKILIILIMVLSLSTSAYAAGNGEIKGRVTLDGKAVAGARVLLINEDIESMVSTTDKDGYYSFDSLPYGKYLITVNINGKFYVKYTIKK